MSAARLASVSAGQFLRLRVLREVMRAMAAQPSSETFEAFCRLRLVRWRMLDHSAKPLPAKGANICSGQTAAHVRRSPLHIPVPSSHYLVSGDVTTVMLPITPRVQTKLLFRGRSWIKPSIHQPSGRTASIRAHGETPVKSSDQWRQRDLGTGGAQRPHLRSGGSPGG